MIGGGEGGGGQGAGGGGDGGVGGTSQEGSQAEVRLMMDPAAATRRTRRRKGMDG